MTRRGYGEEAAVARLAMGELEATIMDVLWERGGWLTPGEVHEVLAADRPLAYTTVMTILVRLWRKGRLERHRDGRAFAYRPLHSREEHAAARMAAMLRAAGDRPAALARFVDELSPADRAQLRRLLHGSTGTR
ncbi:MAG: BlaI/MecI/CopY family transcriptional regulator [Acidimicrobiales bacterium]